MHLPICQWRLYCLLSVFLHKEFATHFAHWGCLQFRICVSVWKLLPFYWHFFSQGYANRICNIAKETCDVFVISLLAASITRIRVHKKCWIRAMFQLLVSCRPNRKVLFALFSETCFTDSFSCFLFKQVKLLRVLAPAFVFYFRRWYPVAVEYICRLFNFAIIF